MPAIGIATEEEKKLSSKMMPRYSYINGVFYLRLSLFFTPTEKKQQSGSRDTHWENKLFVGKLVESIEACFDPGRALWHHPDHGLDHLQPVQARLHSCRAFRGFPDVAQSLRRVLVTSWIGSCRCLLGVHTWLRLLY